MWFYGLESVILVHARTPFQSNFILDIGAACTQSVHIFTNCVAVLKSSIALNPQKRRLNSLHLFNSN